MVNNIFTAAVFAAASPVLLLGAVVDQILHGPNTKSRGTSTKHPTIQLHGKCPVCRRKLWCKV